MTIQRIKAILILVSLLAMPALAADNFVISPLADHLYRVAGPTGNTLVAVDEDGLILVDGVPAQYAREYLGFVREETGVEQVKALVLSHWHPEVTGLNALLGPRGVEIVAHDNTRQWLATTIRERGETIVHTPVPADQLPTRTFYHGSIDIPFRGERIEVGYMLQAHTDGDVYAWFPGDNVLFAGSPIRSDDWATVDEVTNGFIGGLMDAYDTLAGIMNEMTVIVPGSGELMSKADFDDQHAMYKALNAEMVSLLRQSRSAEEVVIANPAAGLRPQWGDPAEFLDRGFRSFFGHLRNGPYIGGGFP